MIILYKDHHVYDINYHNNVETFRMTNKMIVILADGFEEIE